MNCQGRGFAAWGPVYSLLHAPRLSVLHLSPSLFDISHVDKNAPY